MATACYVAGYVQKKALDTDTFNLMSRRPGIGHRWLETYKSDIVRTGNVVIEGREYAVPARYLEWSEEDFTEIRKQRKAYFQNMTPMERWKRTRQLSAKEANYYSRNGMLNEKL